MSSLGVSQCTYWLHTVKCDGRVLGESSGEMRQVTQAWGLVTWDANARYWADTLLEVTCTLGRRTAGKVHMLHRAVCGSKQVAEAVGRYTMGEGTLVLCGIKLC